VARPHLSQRTWAIALLHAAVFASGAAGLVWQVLWVRQLSWVTGATTEAAAIGTAVFLGGLGVGAWLGGQLADSARTRPGGLSAYLDGRPLRTLALVELAVATLGLLLASVLPMLVALPDLSTVNAAGWHVPSPATVAAQLAVAVLLIGPPCVAMGATLPLAARAAIGDRVDQAGWRIGLLYAANTAGAALGALGADLLLVPAMGVWGAQLVAAGANLFAAGIALAAPRISDIESWLTPPAGRPGRAALVLACTGFAALGLEIVHVRFLGSALGPYRAVFSLVLAMHLVGLWAGSLLGGAWTRGGGKPAAGLVLSVTLFVGSALGGLLRFDPEALLLAQLAAAPAIARFGATLPLLGVDLRAVAGVVLVPAIALGATFPLANALAQQRVDTVGRTAGALAGANTAGNATGALITAFVLLPTLGLHGTVGVLTGVAVLGAALVARRASWMGVAAGALATGAWLTMLPGDALLWRSFPANRAQAEGVLAVREGVHGTVVVTGRPEGPARLWTDGHPMTSTTHHAQRYMRVLAHAPLLLQDSPQTAVIIGFGVGNTTHAAALHGLDRVQVVDRSPDVLAHADWFSHANHGVLQHPAVAVHVDDGRHHLHTLPPGSLDLIALEPPPIGHAGVSSLYSRDLYILARSRLRDTGAIAQWLPAYQLPAEAVASLVRAFVDIFPDAVLLAPAGRELVLLGHLAPTPFDPDAVAERLRQRPEVAADLARFGLDQPDEWVVMFGANGDQLVSATLAAVPVSDDRPLLEHQAVSHVMETQLPPHLLDPSAWRRWCPGCTHPTLPERMEVTHRVLTSPAYSRFSNLVSPTTTSGVVLVDATVEERRTIASSATLKSLTGTE
jgi:spermidine synthase